MPDTTSRGVRVLIAEDDFLVGEMIRGVLDELGYESAGTASDGRKAVEMTETLRPDVVIMDIKMPEMDGVQATQAIQRRCPTPVVVLTAYDEPELLQKTSAAGVGAYLVKPPRAAEMERAIEIARARFQDMLELRNLNTALESRNRDLREALANVKTLRGLLPICSSCKKIRDDAGYWRQVEEYFSEHSEVDFSHGLCPDCLKRMFPEYYEEDG